MKIENKANKKLTPKQYASDLLFDAIYNTVQEWYTKESEYYGHKLNEKEIEVIQDQLNKAGTRLMKKLNYNVDLTEIFKVK